MNNKSIGVFDSGMGGVSTLIELTKTMPNENFIYYGDSENAPYGVKTPEEILSLSISVAEKLKKEDIKAIVIACNTATSIAVEKLRELYPELIIIGVEPALKVAVDNGSKNIVVLATETTLRESKFKALQERYASECNVFKIPCPNLVTLIEQGNLKNEELALRELNRYLSQVNINIEDIDSIVLGCTHFIFYKKYLKETIGYKNNIIDGNLGTAKHLLNQLKQSNKLNPQASSGTVRFINSQIIKSTDEINKRQLSINLFKEFK